MGLEELGCGICNNTECGLERGDSAQCPREDFLELFLEFNNSILEPSNVVLKTYMGEQIPVKGSVKVDVSYDEQCHRN